MIKLVKPLFTVLMLGAVVFISSCDKDDEPKPKTKTELISAHPWKITKFKVTQGTASFEDAPKHAKVMIPKLSKQTETINSMKVPPSVIRTIHNRVQAPGHSIPVKPCSSFQEVVFRLTTLFLN